MNFTLSDINCEEVSFRKATFGSSKVGSVSSDYSGTKINCEIIDFGDSTFKRCDLMYMNAHLEGEMLELHGSKFLDSNVYFDRTRFELLHTSFSNTVFQKKASFVGAVFPNQLDFEGCDFKETPDFRKTVIQRHFSFDRLKVSSTNKTLSEDKSSEDKFRRLKELAVQSKDHDKELEFFAGELRAKVIHGDITTMGKLLISLYDILSNFGRSIMRPFCGLAFVWLLFGSIYGYTSVNYPHNSWASFLEGLKLSAAAMLPFMSAARKAISDQGTTMEFALSYPDYATQIIIDVCRYGEGFFGIAFIFLIGLALRNRFRV